MEIYQAIILGVIEGVTEFLPISSTFHLLFAAQFMRLEPSAFLSFFTVFIQAGSILAVLALYGKTLLTNRQLTINVLLSFIPTAIIGFLLYDIIKQTFFVNDALMLTHFIVFGLLFIGYEWYIDHKAVPLRNTEQTLSRRQSILVGVAQALAVIPGVSRSGIVILSMMALGQNRQSAAKYSFLLAIPTIISTAAFDLVRTQASFHFSSQEWSAALVGFVVAFLVSLIVLRWLIQFLQHHSLAVFGYYRILIGLVLIISATII